MLEVKKGQSLYGKGFHGHRCETKVTDTNGQVYEVVTSKRYSGKLLTSATPIVSEKVSSECTVREMDVNNITRLIDLKVRVTKNACIAQHEKGLEMFIQKLKDNNTQK